jgi:hypothetical protein
MNDTIYQSDDGIEVKPISQERLKDLDHIWKNLREYDREELYRQGLRDHNYQMVAHEPECFIGYKDGEPHVVFGHSQGKQTVWLFFFGTDTATTHMKTITKVARGYIDYVSTKYSHKRILVSVWDQHRISRMWLKRLGFYETTFRYGFGDSRFLIVEYKE